MELKVPEVSGTFSSFQILTYKPKPTNICCIRLSVIEYNYLREVSDGKVVFFIRTTDEFYFWLFRHFEWPG